MNSAQVNSTTPTKTTIPTRPLLSSAVVTLLPYSAFDSRQGGTERVGAGAEKMPSPCGALETAGLSKVLYGPTSSLQYVCVPLHSALLRPTCCLPLPPRRLRHHRRRNHCSGTCASGLLTSFDGGNNRLVLRC
jgi:hypothetical protein